jgi:hypothetical protein
MLERTRSLRSSRSPIKKPFGLNEAQPTLISLARLPHARKSGLKIV